MKLDSFHSDSHHHHHHRPPQWCPDVCLDVCPVVSACPEHTPPPGVTAGHTTGAVDPDPADTRCVWGVLLGRGRDHPPSLRPRERQTLQTHSFSASAGRSGVTSHPRPLPPLTYRSPSARHHRDLSRPKMPQQTLLLRGLQPVREAADQEPPRLRHFARNDLCTPCGGHTWV